MSPNDRPLCGAKTSIIVGHIDPAGNVTNEKSYDVNCNRERGHAGDGHESHGITIAWEPTKPEATAEAP